LGLFDWWKERRGGTPAPGSSAAGRSLGLRPGQGQPRDSSITRPSPGLDQFFQALRDQYGLSLLDFSPATQENISFITNLGHRLYSEDFLRSYDLAFANPESESDPDRIDLFFNQTLNFPEGHFDGALVWDGLQYVAPSLLPAVMDRLYYVMRPNAYILAMFHAQDRHAPVPLQQFRIADSRTLLITTRGERTPSQVLHNRAIEKLFHKFNGVKFFLSRESLREVIIKR
jgi:hypothetical protein